MAEVTEEPPSEFPAPDVFFLEAPLYEVFILDDYATLLAIEFYSGTLDTHCLVCDSHSVFQGVVKQDFPFINPGPTRRRAKSVSDIVAQYEIEIPLAE